MPTQLSPSTQGLMNDPYGSVFKNAPGFLQAIARAILPNPQVPYAFGTNLPVRMSTQQVSKQLVPELQQLMQQGSRLLLRFKPGSKNLTADEIKSLLPELSKNMEVERVGRSIFHPEGTQSFYVNFWNDANQLSTELANKAAETFRKAGLSVGGLK